MSRNPYSPLAGLKIGIGMTGSFCTFSNCFDQLTLLKEAGAELFPIVSTHAATICSRFGTAAEHLDRITEICHKQPITSIEGAEPFGPKVALDLMVILPCTGNTLAKLAHAITDTPVLMAAKAHIRNQRPLILALSSNDALGLNLSNIGILLNSKNIYFVPFGQDDYKKKPNSMIAHLQYLPETMLSALNGKQIEPILISPFSKDLTFAQKSQQ